MLCGLCDLNSRVVFVCVCAGLMCVFCVSLFCEVVGFVVVLWFLCCSVFV